MYRFTIRDLLWLTVVMAVTVGWWLELRNRGPENAKLREQIREMEIQAASKDAEMKRKSLEKDIQVSNYIKDLEKSLRPPSPLPPEYGGAPNEK
jgi:hypothetical protein